MALPALIDVGDYADFGEYQDAVYERFCGDFCRKPVVRFCGRPLVYDKNNKEYGKCMRFWHIVTEGPVEEKREPNLARYACVGWIRYMVEQRLSGEFAYWRQDKGRLIIATRDFDYLVVIQEKRSVVLLITAYHRDYRNAREQLRRKYEASERLA